jgi:ATP-binding cassette subfamily B protein
MVVQWARGIVIVGRMTRTVRPSLALQGAVRSLLSGALPVALSIATANAVAATADVLRFGFASSAGHRLEAVMWAYVLIFAVQVVISTAGAAQAQIVARHVDGTLRQRVMSAGLQPVGVQALEDPTMRRAFDSARSMGMGAGYTAGAAAGTLPAIVGDRVRLIGYVIGLTYLAPSIGIAFAVLLVVNQDEMLKAMARVLTITALFDAPPFAKYHFELGARSSGAKEARVFGLEHWINERYRRSILSFYEGAWNLRREFTPGLLGVLVLNALAVAAALAMLGHAATSGDLTVAQLTFAVTAVMALSPRFNLDDVLLTIAAGVVDAVGRAERVAANQAAPSGTGDASGLPRATIRFENVSFRYPGSELDVLVGLELELRAGERTALVGPNGAGKTTIVKLLSRLYEPTSGRITIDGRDLASLDPISWRRQLAILFQDFVHYDLAAADNVRYGAVARAMTTEALDAAAVRAGVDFLVDLPSGWDTPLSPRYAGGVDVSGGQWQRVALARALYALDGGARVLVLDEPTASLDVRGEAEIYNHFVELTTGDSHEAPLTTLLISHRFSTVRQADRIIVLADGRVGEDGSHDVLMDRGGQYAAMFRAQAERFANATSGESE